MFKTKTKLVQISGEYALEANGSLWMINDDDEWELVACHEPMTI